MEFLRANKRELLVASSIVVAALAAMLTIALPGFEKVAEGDDRIRSMDATIRARSVAVDEMTALFASAADLEDFAVQSEQEILPRLLESIATKGEIHGVEIVSMKPAATERVALDASELGDFRVESTRLVVAVTVKARYRALGDYLNSLETIPVLVAVRRLSIRRDAESRTALLTASFDIETYSIRTENAKTQ